MHYYVINLPRCTDRKERITKRLKYHGILDQTTFIEAIDKDSDLVKWFEAGNYIPRQSRPEEHACFLSHLKALRAFVSSTEDTAIILEDDAVLGNNFAFDLGIILSQTKQYPLVMLCHLIAAWDGIQKLGSFKGKQRNYALDSITPKVFGAQAYLITKDYANLCLKRLDTSLRNIPIPFVTSELITRLSPGCFVTPPLVIEEAVYSTLRLGNDINVHRKYFSSFGLDNYTAADGVDISKLWS